jgi:hypothetical protein
MRYGVIGGANVLWIQDLVKKIGPPGAELKRLENSVTPSGVLVLTRCVSYPDRTAFIISNPQSIAEILNQKPSAFRIFLVGANQVKHANVTVCGGMSFHDTAVRICQEMLERRLIHIVSDQSNQALQQKVSELVSDSCRFAMSGAIQNALENLWCNLSFVPGSRSVDSARGLFEGIPGIIVASGPSLGKNGHLLSGLKNKAILISCGSTLVPLRRLGITPHFEVVIDPNPAMHEVLQPHLDSTACFVLSLMAQHRISQECAGQRMYFLVNFEPRVTEDLKRVTRIQTMLPAMASVATTALFFALHIRCNPIIFVGQDLCYTDDPAEVGNIEYPKDVCMIETLDGRRVRSSTALKEAFDFYADFIPTIKDRKIINATEGGAGIPGAEHISLAEAAAQYLTRAISLPDLTKLDVGDSQWKSRLKELRNSFNAMHIRAAGFDRKIRARLEKRGDNARISAKITEWFELLRAMAGYEYLACYLDWAFYRADTSDGLEPKLDLLTVTAQTLRQQIRLLERAVGKL